MKKRDRMNMDTDEERAWDEYQEINKQHCNYIEAINRAKEELNKILVWELIDFEDKIKPLMPYIKDKILEELDLQAGKHGEERRETKPLEPETND